MKKQKHQTAVPLVAGTPIQLGGRDYVMPPMSIDDAELYWGRLEAAAAGGLLNEMKLTATLVTACLRRNYPEVTEADVRPHVDFDNWAALSAAVFGSGSFRAWCDQQRAKATAGNPLAPQPTAAAGTGAPSAPASPPPPAGTSETSAS